MRRALISVTEKTKLGDLGRGLVNLGFELVSTGGTATKLREFGLVVTDVAEVTKFPEMLDGRVKTLHPNIFAGILARPDVVSDMMAVLNHHIELFEVVVVNLYAFEEKAKDESLSFDELVEHIDIGGPSLIRAAAKNWRHVYVVTDPDDYTELLEVLRSGNHNEGMKYRYFLMCTAFQRTADYDGTISLEISARSTINAGGEVTRNPRRRGRFVR